MPGLPLVVRETTNLGCNCSRSRSVDQMCRQDSRVHLSAEEAIAAEESLSIYCKPVELYNILQRRAVRHPPFLQRCLHYKIQAKRKKRIQITVALSGFVNDGVQAQNILPLYVLLATPVSGIAVAGHSAVYQLSRACVLTALSECGRRDQATANFVIPEIRKLNADAKAANLTILLVSLGEHRNGFGENGLLKDQLDLASFSYGGRINISEVLTDAYASIAKFEGYCLWGKLPIELLHSSWAKSANLSLGHRAEVQSAVDMHASFLERGSLDEENCIMFQTSLNCTMSSSKRVQVSISAQEIGAREKSPYDSYMYGDVPPSSLSHIIRLRTGNVIFNYRYYNNSLQKTEVTEDFSCPFCLVQCASFKGLRYHLTSSHDLFNFEFWVTEEYQAVNVSVKSDIWSSEVVADGVDPRLQTFFFCSKPLRRRRCNNLVQIARYVNTHVLKLDSPGAARVDPCEGCSEKDATTSSCQMPIATAPEEAAPLKESSLDRFGNDGDSNKEDEEKTPKAFSSKNHLQPERLQSEHFVPDNPGATECTDNVPSTPNTADVCTATTQPSTGNEYAPPVSQSNLAPPAMLQFAKTRKLSVERADPRNRLLLQKRQFFHSHRAQPMALEQVLSDRDSEDEVDDDIADFEDRRMLDDFVDVTKDEKQIMHLWNSFVRKQRVLADGHIPWACEAFSRLHGQDLVRTPALIWCWRLFMIKLWNHSLLDARTMNNCNIILENFRNGDNSDSRQT